MERCISSRRIASREEATDSGGLHLHESSVGAWAGLVGSRPPVGWWVPSLQGERPARNILVTEGPARYRAKLPTDF